MKKIISLFIIFSFSLVAIGQSVDFSGKWKLNSTKSQLSDQFSMAPNDIVVSQKGNSFEVERHLSFQDQDFTTNDKFTLDGKECINPGWQDSQKKSTAVWSDDKKSLTIDTKFPMGDGGEMTIIEVYKFDGANLVIVSTASSSFGDMEETIVFDKQ